jgi:hypothetical protein
MFEECSGAALTREFRGLLLGVFDITADQLPAWTSNYPIHEIRYRP